MTDTITSSLAGILAQDADQKKPELMHPSEWRQMLHRAQDIMLYIEHGNGGETSMNDTIMRRLNGQLSMAMRNHIEFTLYFLLDVLTPEQRDRALMVGYSFGNL